MELHMNTNNGKLSSQAPTSIGYTLGVLGIVLVLFWIGIYKYTPTEAAAIKPLVENHPLMGWLYSIMSDQLVSNLVGTAEIIVGIGLLASFKSPKIGVISGLAASVIFIVTLSFLLTTPGLWSVSDGVPITNFFLVKDIMFLAVAISVVERNRALL